MSTHAARINAYGHGGAMHDPSPFIKIHSTEGPMSDGNARALANWFARSPKNGGPGTSATDIFDPTEGVRMLDPWIVPYDCGPYGNPKGTGSEHCGSVHLTKEQWLSPRGKAMLDLSARANAEEAHRRKWTLAQCRWLTVSEVARFVPGFCTHNDIRLALGGTTHSDPGPNFPYTWYMDRVRFWFQNPNGTTNTAQEDTDVATELEFKTWMNQCLENKLGLGSGQDMSLAVYGATTNKDVFNRLVATNNPASLASMLGTLVKSVTDLTALVVSVKNDTGQLTDDEQKILDNANANADEVRNLLTQADVPPVDAPEQPAPPVETPAG